MDKQPPSMLSFFLTGFLCAAVGLVAGGTLTKPDCSREQENTQHLARQLHEMQNLAISAMEQKWVYTRQLDEELKACREVREATRALKEGDI